ncbi:GIY-YIG nuclease family protein [Sansalvadorimonas verongulae]|uniref:GIY-YIG nuclease family protein n=1 Tax=Sansalvadorimonas verongulae TaxID=2172824 RepID=UPI0012BCA30A|nr:GIY-YIG nuclease family protein [Sansalvadorimonas verongulae]MTI12235.1 GIY-YIG nuclease family protein [Sansalvadorimonas verongulae]
MKDWFLYFIRCNDNSLYCGITTDVERRFAEHSSGNGKAARYIRGRRPLTLAFSDKVGNHSQALKAEYRVKKYNKATKEKLVAGQVTLQELLNDQD